MPETRSAMMLGENNSVREEAMASSRLRPNDSGVCSLASVVLSCSAAAAEDEEAAVAMANPQTIRSIAGHEHLTAVWNPPIPD